MEKGLPLTIEHFILHCPLSNSHHATLLSWLSALGITTLDLRLLAAQASTIPGNLLSFALPVLS
ncbi:hypothetical protein E2C01_060587 [Portunus trituberculatus]|uniref:Uncharacterized protein n=1 Tax=Portunus trituberculatus TaxID=210409 RepID=A0A5B7H2W6_PORTR|nr:hypothetical protein [Portunus trituberculatus]